VPRATELTLPWATVETCKVRQNRPKMALPIVCAVGSGDLRIALLILFGGGRQSAGRKITRISQITAP